MGQSTGPPVSRPRPASSQGADRMATSRIRGPRIRGIATCVPAHRVNNVTDTHDIPPDEVRKVVAMAGVGERRVVDEHTCSSDLCFLAADEMLTALGWPRETVEAVVMVTQTPDYFMPSSSCLLQHRLGLSEACAAFDVGLGCSGYVYGLWLASMMLDSGGLRRVLVLHGETPTRYASSSDRAVSLLFGDAGSATALEAHDDTATDCWSFALYSNGAGAEDLIIRAGGFRDRFGASARDHFVHMNGANVFNFTIRAIPPLMAELLRIADRQLQDVDYYIFHQSNRFIINHLVHKCGLPVDRVPLILDEYGNAGGPSITLAITRGVPPDARQRPLTLMLLGYGVGLSWGGALVTMDPSVVIRHVEWPVDGTPFERDGPAGA